MTGSPTPPAHRILAGIDIGTLTCRLLIAEMATTGHLRELHSDRRILRLGEGVDRGRVLRNDAMDRVIATLKEWRKTIDAAGAEAATAVATSAVRDAANRDVFLNRVKQEAGFLVEIISGEEEARRTMLGIRSGLPVGVTEMLALDIGGGSTEFVLDRRAHRPIVRSIDIGVVRLTERVLHGDPPTTAEVRQARDWITAETTAAVAGMPLSSNPTFVGTAGTITSLAAMAQRLPIYQSARVHNYTLTLGAITALEEELLSRSRAQRTGMLGLEKGREDVIAGGAIILRRVMETLEMPSVLVSDLGLREGVLIDLGQKLGELTSEGDKQA
jgi:exopolyphosphatase/guanosine-5'-triphosphate,3'-diphosphate pyrophosphatase